MTVCQLYEKYPRQRGNVRKGTQKSRQQLMKLLSEDKLGAASIDSVKLSDAKEWALRMQEKGVAYNTICNSKRSLKAIFYIKVFLYLLDLLAQGKTGPLSGRYFVGGY